MLSSPAQQTPKFTNRLASEKSPYLLQHQHNPVDWWSWCDEVFQRAQKENKPIFLSIGYSTCHWCHVMERESFENEETAAIMNELFYNIKVDREERPDIDKTFLTFMEKLGVGGGWPMSVWLTPEGLPVWGGTYYPPKDMYGRPSFSTVLRRVAELWQEQREDLLEEVQRVFHQMKQSRLPFSAGSIADVEQAQHVCFQSIQSTFDKDNGGFSNRPKFPTAPLLSFLLRYSTLSSDAEAVKAREMALFTLRRIARGGIHDHLGGGFHRYSVDSYWHIPHYEKMLYDQAQMAKLYVEAFQLTGEEQYANTAKDVFEYVRRDLTHPDGGVFSAEDADSWDNEGQKMSEGAFYIWKASEIEDVLGPGSRDWELFRDFYSVEEGGNTPVESDPHGELLGTNTLIQRNSFAALCAQADMSPEEAKQSLHSSRVKLLAQRNTRPRPHLDDKVIASWNGMMLSAYATAYQALGEESYLESALSIIDFVKKNMCSQGKLVRSYRGGPSHIAAFTTDYVCLIRGLLDFYEASGNLESLQWANELQRQQHELFWDEEEGAYWNAAATNENLCRFKEVYDRGAEPSDNSVAYHNLMRLSALQHDEYWAEQATRLLRVCHQFINRAPLIAPEMMSYVGLSNHPFRQVVLTGTRDSPNYKQLLREIGSHFDPFRTVLHVYDRSTWDYCRQRHPHLQDVDYSRTAAFICENQSCQLPIDDVFALRSALQDAEK